MGRNKVIVTANAFGWNVWHKVAEGWSPVLKEMYHRYKLEKDLKMKTKLQ